MDALADLPSLVTPYPASPRKLSVPGISGPPRG